MIVSWKPSEAARGVDTATVGPFFLVARKDSCALHSRTLNFSVSVEAKNQKAARKLVIDEARKQLSAWAAELDALEHQETR